MNITGVIGVYTSMFTIIQNMMNIGHLHELTKPKAL